MKFLPFVLILLATTALPGAETPPALPGTGLSPQEAATLGQERETLRRQLLQEWQQALKQAGAAETDEAKARIMTEMQAAQTDRRARLAELEAKTRDLVKQTQAAAREAGRNQDGPTR